MTFLETYRISIIQETCREKNIFGFLFLYCFCIFFFEILYFCILFLLVFQILYFVFQKYLQRSDFENIFQEDSRRRSSSSGVRLRMSIRRTK